MKKWKQVLALLLAVMMLVTVLAACSKNEKPADNQGEEKPAQSEQPTQTEQPEQPAQPEAEEPGEIVSIEFAYLDVAGQGDPGGRVQAAINAITEPEYGIHVNMHLFDMGNYGTQISLMISGAEQLDVVNISPFNSVSMMVSQGQLMDISGLAEQYAPTALAEAGDLMKPYYQNGGLYGIANNRLNATSEWWAMRADLVDELGLTEQAKNVSSWSELEAIFAAAKPYCDANNMYVIGGQRSVYTITSISTGDAFADSYQYDNLGESTKTIMVKDGKVQSLYENPDFISDMERANGWEEQGFIYPDAMIGDDHVDNLMKQGVIFSMAQHTELGIESSIVGRTGYKCYCPMTTPGLVTSKDPSGFGVGIAITAKEPEAGLRFIELMYSDARIINLIDWGIEGEDYVVNDIGEACYPNDDPNACTYHNNDYMIGNQMIALAWEGSGADFRQRAREANAASPRSETLGFLIDTSDLTTEIAALGSVFDEYRNEMHCGHYTEARRLEMVDKLYANGLQGYMDAVQGQLDAWLATQ